MAMAVKNVMEESLEEYDYEILFIDNCSTDGTRNVIEHLCENDKRIKAIFNVTNFGQFNSPFHGLCETTGDCTIALCCDFQDPVELIPVFVKEWEKIPDNEKNFYKGITCRCVDVNGNLVGNKTIPEPYVDMRETEFKYKYRYTGELWGIIRTDVMKEFPFPTPKGLKFYPESVIWDKMAEKYITRYINKSLRIIYSDQENATTVANKNNRFKENYILWNHYLNYRTEATFVVLHLMVLKVRK